MAISAQQVKELRDMTGCGIMDCKRALTESEGNIDKAIAWLREKGMANAEKKSGRIAAEGIVDSYIHMNGRIGVLVEVNIETDFAANTPNFRNFVKDIGMQIAASNPRCLLQTYSRKASFSRLLVKCYSLRFILQTSQQRSTL